MFRNEYFINKNGSKQKLAVGEKIRPLINWPVMGDIYLKPLLLFKMDLFIGVPLHKLISLLLKKNL